MRIRRYRSATHISTRDREHDSRSVHAKSLTASTLHAMLAAVGDRELLLDAVCEHCDLRDRVAIVPPSAKVRGLYFRSIETVLGNARRDARYRELFPGRFAAVRWYPAAEFLTRLAAAGALLESPERVHLGMYEIGRRNAVSFAESLIGRGMLRLLSRDPRKLLQQGVAARRQSYNYGSWELSFPEPQKARMEMTEEYAYIESYMLGAAKGTFDAIALPVQAEAVLDDRFRGRHWLAW